MESSTRRVFYRGYDNGGDPVSGEVDVNGVAGLHGVVDGFFASSVNKMTFTDGDGKTAASIHLDPMGNRIFRIYAWQTWRKGKE